MARRCHAAAWPDGECVLLARVEVEVAWSGGSPTGAWQVADTPGAVVVDERDRPLLAHLRLLQEWLLCAGGGDGSGGLGGGGFDGGGGVEDGGGVDAAPFGFAPDGAAFLLAADDPSLPNAQSLGALASGLLMNTVTSGLGVLSPAVPGTDYYAPGSGPVRAQDGGTGSAAAPEDGQILVGSGGRYVPATLAGAHQLSVTAGEGGITISAPQDLGDGSTPTFAGLATTGAVRLAVAGPRWRPLRDGVLHLGIMHHVVLCDGTTVTTVELPVAEASNRGREYVLKVTGERPAGRATGRTVTVRVAGDAGTIDGVQTTTVTQGNAKTVVSDGEGGWHVIGTVL
jgi:hypothetical protein